MSLFDAYVWIQANWKSFGWPLAVLFCFLWWTKVTPCEKQPQTVTQAQTSTQGTHLVIRYVDRPVAVGEVKPLPCPEIDFSTTEAHWQSQQVTQTASNQMNTLAYGVFVGGGYVGTPLAQAGAYFGPWRVSAVGGFGALGGLASYDIRF